MILAVWFLQTLAAAAACFGVWTLWRRLRREAFRRALLVITGGFLFRAFAGCALFWISYLQLPFARSIQLGRGFWFFAADGMGYFDLAGSYAWRGLGAIAAAPASLPSPFYVQVLALFEYTFGFVGSVGLLLNVLCYLGTASIVVWLARRNTRLETPAVVALLVLSFAPGCALWSLQPLKDSFFVFVLALFVAACVAWQDLWSSERARFAPRALALAALLFAAVYAVSSVRWYAAFALLLALPLFALALWGVAPRRGPALLATLGLIVVCSQAIVLASSAYIPPSIARVLRPGSQPKRPPSKSVTMVQWLELIRRGYDLAPGSTAITAGARVADRRARMPTTRSGRIVTGVAAAFLPRSVAQRLGLIVVQGGRGFWLFADADTLVVDALLVFVVVFCIRSLRKTKRLTPAMLLVLVSTIVIGGPIIYSVSNFGTLFRLRQIIVLLLCLLPLVDAPETAL